MGLTGAPGDAGGRCVRSRNAENADGMHPRDRSLLQVTLSHRLPGELGQSNRFSPVFSVYQVFHFARASFRAEAGASGL